MDQEDMTYKVDSCAKFCGRFAELFARSVSHEQAYNYLRGPLAALEHKMSWQLAERLNDSTPDRRCGREMRKLPGDSPADLQHVWWVCIPGLMVMLAAGLVCRCQAACAGQSPQGGHISDQASTNRRDSGACTEDGGTHAADPR